ncbi:hypothetical protein FRACYDRAFT_251621 [Fragilariopsis cylindrus CCMP1102]|uniref:BTB domain-containing protein n=1 Tax=Fragilariopsis cylindrus CCMP1102 TaxID=635003 RepID=A0A1E7EMW8_9STRA|nr:hypothetical protein FRACYDRAFT_251621 [Fragilariopsis cylindrus CCMP1102]|eukprot:OEU07146.1 hypothetical protein FRACYDRAFT_251621 [Fragilariopsis cylindrus CCMP1102]
MEDGSNSDINNSMTRTSNDTSTGDNNTMDSVVGGRRGESSITDIIAAADDDDVIEIDAGGKIIRALRSTLTLAPDTMFTFMFSGRWEESHKRHNNRVFLDHDPELIEIIINFLRMKKIEDPAIPIRSPKVHIDKKENFEYLLRYFGLTDFFNPSPVFLPLDIGKIDVVQQHQPHVSSVTVTRSDNKIQFSKENISLHFVACKPSLNASSDEGSFWKVTIDEMPEDHNHQWVFLGIIGSLGASYNSQGDPTSYGWSGNSQVWHKGSIGDGDSSWTRFTRGECLHFHLKSNKLTMFSVQKNQKFVIDNINTAVPAYYIHFNLLYAGTKVTLEPLGEDECERMLDHLLNSS